MPLGLWAGLLPSGTDFLFVAANHEVETADNKADTFHNQWQNYRTRKNKTLQLDTTHAYDDPGEYTVVVKVIDVLGNDTTKT